MDTPKKKETKWTEKTHLDTDQINNKKNKMNCVNILENE